ncbi:uncharacterized protein LOC123318609 [Coccinella septempunctata]|uniref:uncharacterized protein LOC123318609 n=1 Tax=Coccinella septempunctata TaxID=41139 RepID=UPI001D0976D6|nr:uncharacterized protein LOC123318609 [Coccinella septempunctata]
MAEEEQPPTISEIEPPSVPQDEEVEVNKAQGLNENFFYNTMLARALLQILPNRDRKSVKNWLDKLADMDQNDDEITLRHEYMWFLLLMMETRKIREPFNMLPPKDLVPLKDAVPTNVYEEVLLWNDQTSFSSEKEHDTKAETLSEKGPPVKTSSPAKFIENNPWPKQGVVCYLAAFSDRDTY